MASSGYPCLGFLCASGDYRSAGAGAHSGQALSQDTSFGRCFSGFGVGQCPGFLCSGIAGFFAVLVCGGPDLE